MKRFPIWTAAVVAAAALAHADAVYFSPRGGCEEALVAAIAAAEESIDVAMYSFTNDRLADALIAAARRGVRVRVLLNYEQLADDWSQGPWLATGGTELRYYKLITPQGEEGIMHLKIVVFDGRIAALGSYNWTRSAEHRNAEILLFTEDTSVVVPIKSHFRDLWEKAPALPPPPPAAGTFVARPKGFLYHVAGCPFAGATDEEKPGPYDPTKETGPAKKTPCPYCIR